MKQALPKGSENFVRPTVHTLHTLNVRSCYINNHFKQRSGSKSNPEVLSYA